MFDLMNKNTKIATKIGAAVTILVLVAACSSKQVINEASIQEPLSSSELTDTAADQNPYVDQAELPVREQETRKVAKRSHSKKKSHKRHVARKTAKPVQQEIVKHEETVKQEEAALPAIGSVENTNAPMPPPPPNAMGETVLDQPLFDDGNSTDFSGLILENWFYILALLAVGGIGYFGFRTYQKRGTTKRKSKRRLVFN